MPRKDEALDWLKQGYSPSRIAKQMGVSVGTVTNYLFTQVGEGRIRRSDIVFSIDEDIRNTIEALLLEKGTTFGIYQAAYNKYGKQLDKDDFNIYLRLRDARITLGDMYELIRDIEVTLHRMIKEVLIRQYGAEEWWRKGVPESVRAECATSLERDPEPANEAYCYTNFIHLKEILDKQWGVFSKAMPKRLSSDKRNLLSNLAKLNQIRNSVMHPIKGSVLTDKDFAFVRQIRVYLELHSWKGHA